MAISLFINGQAREFQEMSEGATLSDLIEVLGLKQDRVALEHNGAITPRGSWKEARLKEADRIELVHFVGGGSET